MSYKQRRTSRKPLVIVIILLLCFILYNGRPASGKPRATTGKPKIAVLTMTTRESSYMYLSLKNKWSYAKRHDYDLFIDYESLHPKGPVWHKLDMIEDTLNRDTEYDWIWWIDFDVLITNMTIKLENIISEELKEVSKPNNVEMLLTADCFPLNAGSMLLRVTPKLQGYMTKLRTCGEANKKYSEQDCLRDMIADEKWIEKGIVKMVPQWKMNAFPDEIRCYDDYGKAWQRGLFLVHFAGAWAHVKEDDPTGFLMRKYEDHIVY